MRALLWAALLAGSVAAALSLNGYFVFVLANVALLALVGVGLNLLIGLAGLISFGHVGFYAIGAYAVAILTTQTSLGFWAAWPLAAALAAGAGALLALPALRVKGPYLAMVTIAFGFIVENAIVEARGLTGGQNGLLGIAAPPLFGLRGERAIALLALAATAVALAAFALLARGSWGAAWRAVRDAETAAESLGLNPLALKTAAFALSAACAGAAGALAAPLAGMVTPHSFGFGQSILFVLVVVIGGVGSLAGPVLGALVVGLLPEFLAGLEDGRLLFFGALLLVVLWVAPNGFAGLARRWGGRTPAPSAPAADVVPATLPQRVRAGLAAVGLTKQFGGVRAVHDVGFDVAPGHVTSLIGPNGAGKTTALNLLTGFYAPDSGRVALGARALEGRRAWQIARAGVARSYQTSLLFGSLSVEDNVALASQRGRLGPLFGGALLSAGRDRARSLLAFCGYRGRTDTPAADLAHVDRRLVEIARALATDPDVLLLDEPAAGLSSEDKARLAALLRQLADAGLALLLVEHDMALVMGVSDQVVVLDAGQRIAVGTAAAVQGDPAVQRAYLGEGLARPANERAAVSRAELLGVGALTTGYGAEPVLKALTLHVGRGEAVALLGANGAGKSTLMRTLAGLHRPFAQGGVHFEGHDLARHSAEQTVRLGLVLVPEGRQVFAELSVLDNLRLGAFLRPAGRDSRIEALLQRFPRLRERLQQRAGLLSGGEQQMLAIGRALMGEPRLLLLDEPSLGLAPKVIAELFDALDRLRDEGLTLLVVDQLAALALAVADRAYVIEGGRIVAEGSAAQIAADPALARAYFGTA